MSMRFFRWYRPMDSTTGYTLPSLWDGEILRRCFLGETMHKSVFSQQLRHAVREDFFPDGEGVEDFFGFSGGR
ncbi:MAG: hypothetical protein RLZZ224_1 [Verrucomicrobiota bacterium]